MMNSRKKIIQMVDKCLNNNDEWMKSYKFKNMTELQSYIKSDEYSLLKVKRYYDDILQSYIHLLGLRFALYHDDNLTDWYKSSDNQPIDEQLDKWEQLINGTSNR